MANNSYKCLKCGESGIDVDAVDMQCPRCGGMILRAVARITTKKIVSR